MTQSSLMQKMWAISVITIVAFMMIISSIPQDAFAGKHDVVTLKITIDYRGSDLSDVDGTSCTAIAKNGTLDEGGGFFIKDKDSDIVIKGKTAKVSFEFEDEDKEIKSYEVSCDGSGNVLIVDAEKKNTRAVYLYDPIIR